MTGIRLRSVAGTGAAERKSAEEDTQGDSQDRELNSHLTGDGEKSESDGGDQVPGIQIHRWFSPTGSLVIFVAPPSDGTTGYV